jgi:hypothetical protein
MVMTDADRRRYGVIETQFRQHGKLAMYNLTINRQLWACVKWSPSRKAWCVQDASGRCLAHCDAIHGENVDAQTAVKLAKAMIKDGRMPTPEEAQQQLKERLRRDHLGEPMEIIGPRADAALAPQTRGGNYSQLEKGWKNKSRH